MKNESMNAWTPTKHGLCRYKPSGMYYARVRYAGKLHRRKLGTTDFAYAKRKLADFKRDLERTDHGNANISLIDWLKTSYAPTLKGAPGAMKAKQRIIDRINKSWFSARKPMRELKKSQVLTFLNEHYGEHSESYWNSALTLIRDAFDLAVSDHVITENPVAGLKYQKRKKPIRPTPTFEQFQQIVASIREQKFNGHDAQLSGDFLEFIGLAGLGQAEAAAIKRSDVDLASERIIVYRHKTDAGFVIPIYPQVRPLVEKLCEGKAHNDRLFSIDQARKALSAACERLGFPHFTHRSLRRMFITRAIELGVDVKVIAEWQGHRDGGKLILDTYSHVRPQHSWRMAQLMTSEKPANVVEMQAATVT